MFGIGIGEFLIIILIIFIISPKDIPKAMKKLGQFFNALNRLRDEISNLKDDVNEVIKDSDIKADLKEVDNNIKLNKKGKKTQIKKTRKQNNYERNNY